MKRYILPLLPETVLKRRWIYEHADESNNKKDLKNILSDKRMFSAILMVPLIMTVVLPAIFMVAVYFGSDDPDLQQMLALLPQHTAGYDIRPAASAMIFNNIMPILFFIIPVMTASVMAASSFVGEKEKHTLETLLYCPLSVRQIFQAKIAASFFLSMLVSLISFAAMALVLETISYILMGILLMPGLNWLVTMFIISPAISLIAITLIVRGSAKAKSVEESQQRAVFIVIPVILLMAGQLAGFMLISPPVMLIIGLLCALLAGLLLKFTPVSLP